MSDVGELGLRSSHASATNEVKSIWVPMPQMRTATELRLAESGSQPPKDSAIVTPICTCLACSREHCCGWQLCPCWSLPAGLSHTSSQRSFSNAGQSLASHSSDLLTTPARPERSWVPAAPQALASCLAPTCRARARGVLLLLCLFLVPELEEGLRIGKGWAGYFPRLALGALEPGC